jgi:hypothetical protein
MSVIGSAQLDVSMPEGESLLAKPSERTTPPVAVWAGLGGLIMAFEAFVLIRWVAGPYFKTVPSGPSVPPQWMRITLTALQVLTPAATAACVYYFIIRPWRRGRPLSVDGVMVIAFLTMYFQDPMANYVSPMFSYNSWLVNFGSWTNDIPGWMSFGQPGHMLAEPIILISMAYIPSFVVPMVCGPWLMRKAKSRWPRMSKLEVLGVCFVAMCAYDFLLEGCVFTLLGAYALGGGALAVFPSTYHKFPLSEAITIGALCTFVAWVRYDLDDHGRSIAERGVDRLRASSGTKVLLRILAMIAVLQLGLLLIYIIPNMWVGAHSTAWPADIQKRSYLTDYLCGDGTDRACPGPAVPNLRNDNGEPLKGSAHVSPTGALVWPPDTKRPSLIRFVR